MAPGRGRISTFALFVVSVPLAVPLGFGLDLHKSVTSSTADFSWEAIKEDSVLLNGLFTGYKVSQLRTIAIV